MRQTTRASFVVRVARDRDGRLTGVVERVATGAKELFSGAETIGAVIGRMLERPGLRARRSHAGPPAQPRPRRPDGAIPGDAGRRGAGDAADATDEHDEP
jgi:hypothetical protein